MNCIQCLLDRERVQTCRQTGLINLTTKNVIKHNALWRSFQLLNSIMSTYEIYYEI